MNVTTNTTNTTHTAAGPSRRRLHRRAGRRSTIRPTRSRRTAQPLYEALSVGLGCTSTGYRMSTPPEWR